jgi:hypothetical protein
MVATNIKILLLLQSVDPGNRRLTGTLGPYLELAAKKRIKNNK